MAQVSAIFGLLALLSLVMMLKRVGLLSESYGPMFSQLVTRITLPALIFYSLTHSQLVWSEAEIALVMLLVTLACLFLGWLVANSLNLDGPKKAAVILTSGFGASSTLGFTVVEQVLPGNTEALVQAIIISSMGVQPVLFTLGTAIAMYYGDNSLTSETPLKSLHRYLKSPIFIAFSCGLAISLVPWRETYPLFPHLLKPFQIVAHSNPFLVILASGLVLQIDKIMESIKIAACVATIKLLIMPLLLWFSVHLALSSTFEWQVEVLIIEGSMSSALLSVILCGAFGCDAKLAGKLVAVTLVLSLISTPILVGFLH